MTSVLGHLTGLDFDPKYKNWRSCPPSQLFEAVTVESVPGVRRFARRSVWGLIYELGQNGSCSKYQYPSSLC